MFPDQLKSVFFPGKDSAPPESARLAEKARIQRALAEFNLLEPGYVQPASRSGLISRIGRLLNP